jgi:hypothetical protein
MPDPDTSHSVDRYAASALLQQMVKNEIMEFMTVAVL